MPSSITVSLVHRAMSGSTNKKFLIDGFPRNEENIETWEGIIGDKVRFLSNVPIVPNCSNSRGGPDLSLLGSSAMSYPRM